MHRWRHTCSMFRSRAIGLTLRLLMYWTCEQNGLVQPSVLTARKTFFFLNFRYVTYDTGRVSCTFTEGSCHLLTVRYRLPDGSYACFMCVTFQVSRSNISHAVVTEPFWRFLQYLQTITVTVLNIGHDNFRLQSQSSFTALLSFDAI